MPEDWDVMFNSIQVWYLDAEVRKEEVRFLFTFSFIIFGSYLVALGLGAADLRGYCAPPGSCTLFSSS